MIRFFLPHFLRHFSCWQDLPLLLFSPFSQPDIPSFCRCFLCSATKEWYRYWNLVLILLLEKNKNLLPIRLFTIPFLFWLFQIVFFKIMLGPILESKELGAIFEKKGWNIWKFGQKCTKFKNILKKGWWLHVIIAHNELLE